MRFGFLEPLATLICEFEYIKLLKWIQENPKSEDSEKDINSDKAKNISIENDVIKKDVAKECSPVEHTIKTHNNKLSRPKKDILISESKKNSEKIISDL